MTSDEEIKVTGEREGVCRTLDDVATVAGGPPLGPGDAEFAALIRRAAAELRALGDDEEPGPLLAATLDYVRILVGDDVTGLHVQATRVSAVMN